ncbi:MAG: hypothetical protein IKO45_03125 [Clostridia bacterium]|nr:hypothetical protein [Clostridia bacterium]
MKKALLIVGIAMTVIGVLSLILGALRFWAYHSVLDGSPSMYQRLKGRAIAFTVAGAVIVVTGIVMLVIRKMVR